MSSLNDRRYRIILCVVMAVCVLCLSTPPAWAVSFTVDNGTDLVDNNLGDGICEANIVGGGVACTLRAAIQEANALAGADDITLPAGIIALDRVGTDDTAVDGDLDITENLTITGAGSAATTVQVSFNATGPIRVFHVDPAAAGISVNFSGFTISDGEHPTQAGGIYNQGNLTLTDVNVNSNDALQTVDDTLNIHGGGIFNDVGATLTVSGGEMTENMAENSAGTSGQGRSRGGAIYNAGTANLTNVLFDENEANNGSGLAEGGTVYNAFGANLTMSGSNISISHSDQFGGGIFNVGTANLSNAQITTSSSNSWGGGIYNNGSLQLTNMMIDTNTASGQGVGILNASNGDLTMDGGSIQNNTCIACDGIGLYNNTGTATLNDMSCDANLDGASSAGGSGGCFYSRAGSLTMNRSSITNNFAESNGGGGYARDGTLVMDQVTVDGNNVLSGSGGGLFFTNIDTPTTGTITHSVFSNNSAGFSFGGGIANSNTRAMLSDLTLNLSNVTISGNISGAAQGAGLANDAGVVNLNNVTITDNGLDLIGLCASADGCGIFNFTFPVTGTFNISNSLIAENGGLMTAASPDCSGTFVSLDYNLIGDGETCTGFTGPNDLVGTNNAPIDPVLGPLQNNGGLTETHELLALSPAIDTANPALPGSGGGACEQTDQRLLNRSDLLCDRGAFEAAATAPICGDSFLDVGEQCDDGNTTNGDGCDDTCIIEVCGNGVLQSGETCDDGNLVDGDGCDSLCNLEACGNGIIQAGEDCDDAGESATCNADCTTAVCGDGLLNTTAGEACDDGNTSDGDGCSATCQDEDLDQGGDPGGGGDDGGAGAGDGAGDETESEQQAAGPSARGGTCDFQSSLILNRPDPTLLPIMLFAFILLALWRGAILLRPHK